MTSEAEFAGKSVVITGAGGGLGGALVALFASRGAKVIACDMSAENLSPDGIAARYIFDLLDPEAGEAAAKELMTAQGVPDILINNAGWTRAETVMHLDSAKITHEIDLNLTGVLRFCDPVAKAMAARGAGSIVFVSSVNALSHFGNPAYAAAKAGINAYGKALAVELGGNNVRANIVCPGSIRTQAWDHRFARDPDLNSRLQKLYPLGRIVNASEVAEAIAFLASERASGITGAVLPVDAGLTAGQLPFLRDIIGA